MGKLVHINTLLLTDEELRKANFKNEDGLYFSIRKTSDGNEVRVYAVVDV